MSCTSTCCYSKWTGLKMCVERKNTADRKFEIKEECVKLESEGKRGGVRRGGGEVFVDAIGLPCYLSPRQVQIWSLSFLASLHIHSPSQTQSHTFSYTSRQTLPPSIFHSPLFSTMSLTHTLSLSLSLRHTHTHKQTYISIKPKLNMMNVVTF